MGRIELVKDPRNYKIECQFGECYIVDGSGEKIDPGTYYGCYEDALYALDCMIEKWEDILRDYNGQG